MPLDALNIQRGPAGAKELMYSDWPMELVTGTGASPRPRLRVDPGQTAFFEGRQFRVFHEFNIAAGASQWLRFIAPLDVIVTGRNLSVVQGNLRFALGTGGTPGGTWTAKTVQGINTMAERPSPLYAATVTAASGGTQTGIVEQDLAILETGTSQAVSVQSSASEVGLAAGTYYVELRNTGTGALRGLYTVVWEERQARSPEVS